MLASQYPYRSFTPRPPPLQSDPLVVAAALARLFVVVWSCARVVVSVVRGFDFEGLLAVAIVALTIPFRARSLFP
jgi:hypothetical protein